MKTTPVTKADFERSVLAVPPIARRPDFSLNETANSALIRYLESGGIKTLMYGGNANFYHLGLSDIEEAARQLIEVAGSDTWVIPSIGPEFGKALDQARLLAPMGFPTVMVLPTSFPMTPAGVPIGIANIAERFGNPVIAYVKAENYARPADLAALIRHGYVCAIKYGVVRQNPTEDAYLSEILQHVERDRVVSGIGERPAPAHLLKFGLVSFTSGAVCIAPRLSLALLAALKSGDQESALKHQTEFLPVEDLRDRHSPIRTLHTAVTLSGIADMGPMQPMLTEITDPAARREIERAAHALRAKDEAAAGRRAA